MNFLKSTTEFVGNAAQKGVHGLEATGEFVGQSAQQGIQGVGKGVNSGVNAVAGVFSHEDDDEDNKSKDSKSTAKTDSASQTAPRNATNTPSQHEPPQNIPPPPVEEARHSGLIDGITGGFKTVGSAFVSTAHTAGDALQVGAGVVGDVTKAGLSISEKVARTGVDMTGNVVIGTVGLAGTAVGGVVNAAAETSGKVFEPVVAGMKSIEGLQALANHLEKINGLPMAAVRQVSTWTFDAIKMSGKSPTFFDADGDGIVRVADTTKGLIILGLPDNYAAYAAYALHLTFSYSTSESWIPALDSTLPIRVKNMNATRWGKNWGQFDRIEWCSDLDIEEFFKQADEDIGLIAKWRKQASQGRQGFGVLLLIFEWGTTWPFLMPPIPAAEIPFKDDIGKVVRTVILPTIFKNWQRAHGIEPNKDSEPIAKSDVQH